MFQNLEKILGDKCLKFNNDLIIQNDTDNKVCKKAMSVHKEIRAKKKKCLGCLNQSLQDGKKLQSPK